MKPVQAISQLFDAIEQAKAGASDFCTNFFPVQKKLQEWIERDSLYCECRPESTFIFRRDRDFWHLYYCSASKALLYQELATIPEIRTQPTVLDIVGKACDLPGILKVFEASGFRRYGHLLRMALSAAPAALPQAETEAETEPMIDFASTDDAQSIVALLESVFDRFDQQIPMRYEIEAAIQARQILVARVDGEIAGLLYFEPQGLSSTLRFWAVAPEFRASKLGSALIRRYLATQNMVKRFVLWVAAGNSDAIEKYAHYGYQPDGLVDYVIANEMVIS